MMGALFWWQSWYPVHPYLVEAFAGVHAMIRTYISPPGELDGDVWWLPEGEDVPSGLTALNEDLASPGLTLVTVGESAHLIALDGTVRHTWHLPYRDIFGKDAVVARMPAGTRLYWRPARAFPDGDLLAIVDIVDSTPEGVALIRIDKDSNLRWVFHGHVHHDFDIAPDGRIYVLGQGLRRRPPQKLWKIRGPLLDERLLILSPQGKLLQDISILDALARSPYAVPTTWLLAKKRYDKGDYLHSNNLDVAGAADARLGGFIEEGQVLLSFRNLSMIAVLDPDSATITWARRGSWRMQHDPDFRANGNLFIYDNQGDWDRGGRTRIIEYEPKTGAIVWEYPGNKGRDLINNYRGELQEQPNGNILINEFIQARLLEVTRDGQTVWEYRCPFRYPKMPELRCRVMHVERYPPGTLDFELNGGSKN